MTMNSLTIEMKSTIALIGAWVALLLITTVVGLVLGPADIYVAASLVVAIPYLVLIYFARKRKTWAFLGSSILSVLLVFAVPFSIQSSMSEVFLWETTLATLLAVLIALEGYKSYLQSKLP